MDYTPEVIKSNLEKGKAMIERIAKASKILEIGYPTRMDNLPTEKGFVMNDERYNEIDYYRYYINGIRELQKILDIYRNHSFRNEIYQPIHMEIYNFVRGIDIRHSLNIKIMNFEEEIYKAGHLCDKCRKDEELAFDCCRKDG
jgi:hypothetical protein